MWDVDPETKSKLLALQKLNGNDRCCDCGAPSPQWASPKFSTFICLTCAGLHRSLGVHISFVRSITMDAFKPAEVARLTLGGNTAWRTFWENHPEGGGGPSEAKPDENKPKPWSAATIAERYSGRAGAEWKERLSATVEGRPYVAPPAPRVLAPGAADGAGGPSATARNESFFARKGDENAMRPEDRAPSLGGKAGSGGGVEGLPGVDELQRDAVAAVGKGLGWLKGAVGKGVAKIAEADIANSARVAAAQVALTVQTGTKSAAEGLQRGGAGKRTGLGATQVAVAGAGTGVAKEDGWEEDGWERF
ncbi:MAG: zinc finger gcs1 [Lasallia pustulata]|uniref:Zinc finger gcs1 n=1 Tax=Lasallia pustulata TaxID=136370 RepID=A0A5M8PQN8_9LECA|nr:MAG: zinc finger gcs1 [Lasallia pustulata]